VPTNTALMRPSLLWVGWYLATDVSAQHIGIIITRIKQSKTVVSVRV